MSNLLSFTNSSFPPNHSTPPSVTQQFLRFHLIPHTTALLPIQQLTEVLTIPPGQIVPISHMPPWVMGVYNWRGEILWMIDLGHLIGLTPWHQQENNTSAYPVIVLQSHPNPATTTTVKSLMLGLVVNRVEDIEWFNPDLIQSPPPSPMAVELLPFLQGYWLKSNGDMLAVIDGSAIMAAMPKL
ncbi:MAG TPA: chemotaxis protein CheW [Stenomitos sp.]